MKALVAMHSLQGTQTGLLLNGAKIKNTIPTTNRYLEVGMNLTFSKQIIELVAKNM